MYVEFYYVQLLHNYSIAEIKLNVVLVTVVSMIMWNQL